ncbi:hypothetical protein [Moorena producens]
MGGTPKTALAPQDRAASLLPKKQKFVPHKSYNCYKLWLASSN